MKKRLKASDLLDIDLGLDVPYSPLKPFHPPKLPALAGRFRVVDLQHCRVAGATLHYRVTPGAREVVYERR